MYESVNTARLARAFVDNVPGCFIRDYTETGGFLQIRRRLKTVGSHDNTDVYTVPAETICTLNRGETPRPTLYKNGRIEAMGWQVQMRVARNHLEPDEISGIERDIGFPIFRKAFLT